MTWQHQLLFLGNVGLTTALVVAVSPPYTAGHMVLELVFVFLAAAGGWLIGRSVGAPPTSRS